MVNPGACTCPPPTRNSWPPTVTIVASATAGAPAALGRSICVVGDENLVESSSKNLPPATIVFAAAPGVNVSPFTTTSPGRTTTGILSIVSELVDGGG